MKFTGQRSVINRHDILQAEAGALLSAWWDRYRDDLPMLKGRYKQVKEIGQRSLNAAKNLRAIPPLSATQSQQLSTASLVSQARPADVLLNKSRVGRNDPCPCGSGAKFKRCCGRHG